MEERDAGTRVCLGNSEFEEMPGKPGYWVWAGDLSVGAVDSEVGCDVVGVGACMWGGGFQAWVPGNRSVWRSVRGEAPSKQINPMGEATSCPR